MLTARAEEETIVAVPGVRFRTNARPDTASERQLQDIQSELSDGERELSSPTTLPHLNYFYAATKGDRPTNSFISLWVPKEQQLQAEDLLRAAGFTVT
jgi:hypothetical protein